MAKQDLVVKLMLDSGAFGNDLRQAERRAKDFSDNMRSAGKTAGDFGNEIGISAGALGKLGGVLSGAAGVVALVGAFKSVMESTHGSAKTFKSTIAGFEGVMETFQRSIANFDFTTFHKGMDEIFKRYKEWKKLQMEAAIANVAYDALFTRDINTFKDLELKFKGAKTQTERDAVRKEVRALLDEMRGNTQNYTDIVNDAFIASVIKGESKIEEGTINADKALTLMYQAMGLINSGGKDADIARYNDIVNEIRNIEYVLENGHVGLGTMHEDEGEKQVGSLLAGLFGMDNSAHEASYDAVKRQREQYEEILGNRDYYTQKVEDLIAENQDLFFRNQLYNLGEEELRGLLNQVQDAINKGRAISELELNYLGWTDPTKATGGSTTKTPKKDPDVRNVMSIGYLEEMIAVQKKMMDEFEVGTSDWWDAVDALDAYQTELDEVKKYQNALLGIVDDNADAVEGSIAYYEELIKEKSDLRDTLKFESEEWHKLTKEIKEYTVILDELKKKQAKYDGDGKSPKPTTKPKSDNEELEEKRKAAVDAWNEREKYDRESDAWAEANERLKEYVAEYQKFVQTLDKNDPIDRLQKKWANANIVVSSSVSLLSALSDTLANSEDESARKAGAWVDVLSTIGAGVQSYISIMQSAIATDEAYAMAKATGQAAMLPFPANIAAIATAVATITSVIAKINSIKKSANKFAEGGIVGGTSYSGDKLFAMVNSGEMILNKRQQRNLGNMLGGGGGQVEFVISGDSLVGVLNNKNRKTNLTR